MRFRSFAWLGLFLSTALFAEPIPGRYEAVAPAQCADGSAPRFDRWLSLDEYDIPVPEAPAGRLPSFWWVRHAETLHLALPAIADVHHWTCPPDGDSVLVRRRFHFLTLFAPGSGGFKRVGSYAPWNFASAATTVTKPLYADVSNELTFHELPEIDGAIERFRYYGPQRDPGLALTPGTHAEEWNVRYAGACRDGSAFEAVYRRVVIAD